MGLGIRITLSTWEGARVPRETRRHVFDEPPRYGCSGASGQAFSAQEVWRDEVNGADRVARADERPIGDRIGQDAFAEAVAEIPLDGMSVVLRGWSALTLARMS